MYGHICRNCGGKLELEKFFNLPLSVLYLGICKKCKFIWSIDVKEGEEDYVDPNPVQNQKDAIYGEKYQFVLGLEDISIIYKRDGIQSKIIFYPQANKYIIFFLDEHTLQHELGHILIDKNPNHFVGDEKLLDLSPRITNVIQDIIVENYLVHDLKIPNYYEIEIQGINKLVNDIIKTKNIRNEIDFANYCTIFLSLHFFLKDKDKKILKSNWIFCLNILRKALIKIFDLSEEIFKDFNERLMEFNDIKDYFDMRSVANYTLRCLWALNKWTKKELARLLKKKFL